MDDNNFQQLMTLVEDSQYHRVESVGTGVFSQVDNFRRSHFWYASIHTDFLSILRYFVYLIWLQFSSDVIDDLIERVLFLGFFCVFIENTPNNFSSESFFIRYSFFNSIV